MANSKIGLIARWDNINQNLSLRIHIWQLKCQNTDWSHHGALKVELTLNRLELRICIKDMEDNMLNKELEKFSLLFQS